jgi:hypothetical protein
MDWGSSNVAGGVIGIESVSTEMASVVFSTRNAIREPQSVTFQAVLTMIDLLII